MGDLYSVASRPEGVVYTDQVENVQCSIRQEVDIAQIVEIDDPEISSEESDRILEQSILHPIGCQRLRDIAIGKKSAAIIISDATRGVDTARVLPYLLRDLAEAGIRMENIVVVVALGVHRDADAAEMQTALGRFWGKVRIVNHQPFNSDELIHIGTTSRGTEVEINKTVFEADVRIGIGKVEPHEFAGYSGGRKSVLPGVAGEKTILHNHLPKFLFDSNAAPCVLENNPVHLDMVEAAAMLRMDFFVNLVQNAHGMPIGAFSGDILESHAAAVAFLEQRYSVDVHASANIFLTTPGVPLNIDFYQAVKPLFGLYPVLKANDVVVLYAACREGVNSPDMLAPFRHGTNCEQVMEYLQTNYRIQMDQALILCKLYRNNVRIIVSSPGVTNEDLETLMMYPAASLDTAMEMAVAFKQADNAVPRVCIFPQAQRAIIGQR